MDVGSSLGPMANPDELAEGAEKFVTVGTTNDIPEGSIVVFDVNDLRIAIANVDGDFFAFDEDCTHRKFSLAEGDVEDTSIFCEFHGAEFDMRDGTVLAGPAEVPLKTYVVRRSGDVIQIAT